MKTGKTLPLDGFQPVLDGANVFEIPEAQVESDGDDWGSLDLAVAQARLEEADDLAILQLRSVFVTGAEIPGMRIEVNAVGLRTLEVDGTYCVPAKGEERPGGERYKLPDPLPAGKHRLEWSYVWNPPKDRSTGEPLTDGVTLWPVRITGPFIVSDAGLLPIPKTVDARLLSSLFPATEGNLSLVASTDVPLGARQLVIEGPVAGTIDVLLDDQPLPKGSGTPVTAPLPPATAGSVTLTLRMTRGPVNLSSVRII
jgi:hypothetical protein